jgi:hypothetical protein
MPRCIQAAPLRHDLPTDRAKSWDSKGFMSKEAQMEHLCRHASYSSHALQ